MAALGAALGAAAGMKKSNDYVATSDVLVNPLVGNPYTTEGNGDNLLNLETEAQLVDADSVVNKVADQLGVEPPVVAHAITVTVPTNTQIVRVAYSATSEQTAVEGSKAVAEAYLAERGARADRAVTATRDRIRAQIDATTRRLDGLEASLEASTSTNQTQVLLGKVDALNAELAQLRTDRAQTASGLTIPGEVVVPASSANRFPVPWWIVGAIAGGLIGAILGALIAGLVRRDRSRVD
jgi:uncharacterized protein involved in exopolysaccharide biosynthesis